MNAHPQTVHTQFLVPDMHCAGCMDKIEKGFAQTPGVADCRVNLTAKRVHLRWRDGETDPDRLQARLNDLGFTARVCDAYAEGDDAAAAENGRLLRCMAVAGFAAANIMLLSVSVWSGADGTTRTLFHWISALIAVPTVLYAGRPFFETAFAAVSKRTLKMDVPISLAVLLALFASLGETVAGGEQVYFEAAAMLLFFLLIGRHLDKMLRRKSRSAVADLLALRQCEAVVEDASGERRRIASDDVKPGDTVIVAAGERFPVDGVVLSGQSDIDNALVTGESIPETAREGDAVVAGAVNLSAPLKLRATGVGADSFIGEMARLVDEVETAKPAAVTLAAKAVHLYAPAVHIVAALAFAGWLWATGDWHQSLLIAIATLIITCPCALGLAVPAVQVVANGVLFRSGILAKDGTALERLAEVDSVRFDKTGTLTTGRPRLTDMSDGFSAETAAAIAGLARESAHPLARSLAKALAARCDDMNIAPAQAHGVREIPSYGIEGTVEGVTVRIGARRWIDKSAANNAASVESEIYAAVGDAPAIRFGCTDTPRPDAKRVAGMLKRAGLDLAILSGDHAKAVADTARTVGIDNFTAGLLPAQKLSAIQTAAHAGHKTLIVGDGINDAPALAAGHVSMAPAEASAVSCTAADMVFLGDSLAPVWRAYAVARAARRIVIQNFALALAYNLIAVPIAIAGYASPLIAAIAMSSSSILVTLNALRLRWHFSADERPDSPETRPRSGRAPQLSEPGPVTP